MNKSESIAQLSAALSKAQGEIENANKNSTNPHFRSRYADLAEVINTIRPVFAKHGLAVIQMPSYLEGVCSVETLLTHDSGEWISNIAGTRLSKDDAQGVGSAITYLRRYSLAAFALITQDDDGNAASGKEDKKPQKAQDLPPKSDKAINTYNSIKPKDYEFLLESADNLEDLQKVFSEGYVAYKGMKDLQDALKAKYDLLKAKLGDK